MDRSRTPLISKLIFAALVAICVCLVVLIAQNRVRNSPPETLATVMAGEVDDEPRSSPEQWDSEMVRLKVTNNLPKVTPRPSVPPRPAPQLAASPEVHGPSDPSEARYAAVEGPTETMPALASAVIGSRVYPVGMPIVGHALLSGQPPPEVSIALDPVCGRLHEKPLTTRHYVVGENGGLANAWVYVQNATGSFSTSTQDVVLDQVGCEYQPYVFAVMTKQPVRIKNSDPFLHNVNTIASTHPAHRFNIAQPNQTKVDMKRFERPELPLKFMCNVHNWMFAYAGVFSHPFFAVTDSEGRFEIPAGLPPGRYTLAARHLKAGEVRYELVITEGAEAAPLQILLTVPGSTASLTAH